MDRSRICVEYRAPEEADYQAMLGEHGDLRQHMLFSLAIFAVVGGLVYVMFQSLFGVALAAAALLLPGLVSGLRAAREVERRRAMVGQSRAVELIHVNAVRVLDVKPAKGDGPALVFFTESGDAVLLMGQWVCESNTFPAARFVLARWSDSKAPIRIESEGPAMVAGPSSCVLPSGFPYGKVEVFNATPTTLAQALQAAFTKRQPARVWFRPRLGCDVCRMLAELARLAGPGTWILRGAAGFAPEAEASAERHLTETTEDLPCHLLRGDELLALLEQAAVGFDWTELYFFADGATAPPPDDLNPGIRCQFVFQCVDSAELLFGTDLPALEQWFQQHAASHALRDSWGLFPPRYPLAA